MQRIAALYAIESEIRGQPPDQRRTVRQSRTSPLLEQLNAWLSQTLTQLSKKSALGGAILYALNRWQALTRYCDDGRIEIDNNAAERALRAVALGRNYPQSEIMLSSPLPGFVIAYPPAFRVSWRVSDTP